VLSFVLSLGGPVGNRARGAIRVIGDVARRIFMPIKESPNSNLRGDGADTSPSGSLPRAICLGLQASYREFNAR
jgi:hypothetical protein